MGGEVARSRGGSRGRCKCGCCRVDVKMARRVVVRDAVEKGRAKAEREGSIRAVEAMFVEVEGATGLY